MSRKTLPILAFAIMSLSVSGLEVSVADQCGAEGAPFLSLNDTEGGHAAEPSYYGNKVCVSGIEYFELRESCDPDEVSSLSLFKRNNSHVSTYDNEYLLHSCAKNLKTRFEPSNTCMDNETKILSLAKKNNSHAAAPTYTDSIYDNSLCGRHESPDNVTLTLSGLDGNVEADGEQITTGETFSPPVDYPYIASENTGILNYGEFLKLSRPETDTVSMTQEDEGSFIIPIIEEFSSIENREDEITEKKFIDMISPSFNHAIPENPLVKVVYRPDQNIESSNPEFANRGEIQIENKGIKKDELAIGLEN